MNDPVQYLMIGGDGRQYGPVGAEELRQWIREGRAVAATQVMRVGSDRWQPLRELAEFAPVPDAAIAPARPPGALRVFAVLFVVLGGLGLLFWPLGLLGLGEMARLFGAGAPVMAWLVLGQVLSLVGALWMLVAGIGLWRRREWGRRQAVTYSWVFAVFGVLNTVVATTLLAERAAGDPRLLGALVGGVVGGVLGVLFNALTIYFLTRPAVREYLKTSHESASC